ncbi:unannotated protein [freshwater metagenome]|uniref:Unannotated protein n=1 Tax=freshwater metagenome TaxID=449393 RepID=A0A6J7BRX3_9ZZZZ
MHTSKLVVIATCAVLTIAACSGSNNSSATTTAVQPTTTAAGHLNDGTLVIGAVLPTVGTASEIGVSMADALQLGVSEINQSGGVNGRQIRLITREEGDNSATAVLAVQSLLQFGVDAIIGPTSVPNLLATLGTAVEAGVLTCAPTASALALDNFPDDGLLLRTVPSDSLQAQAMAQLVESSGSSAVAVVYLDDNYGRPFAEATRAAITQRGTAVSGFVGFTPGEASVSAAVAAVIQARPQVVAVVADAITGPSIINAIDAASDGTITFVVNDAARRPDASAQPFSSALGPRITGVSPIAYATSAAFTTGLKSIDPEATGLFAHNAYDCLNIIALAAASAGSLRPSAIAAEIPGLTTGGTRCSSFPTCQVSLAERRNINYDGPGGNLAIDASGEMTSATFDKFTFDKNSRDVSIGLLRLGDG